MNTDTKELVLKELAASAKRMREKAKKHKAAYYHDEYAEFSRISKQCDEITKKYVGKKYSDIPKQDIDELVALREKADAEFPKRFMSEETRYKHLQAHHAYKRAAAEFDNMMAMTKHRIGL